MPSDTVPLSDLPVPPYIDDHSLASIVPTSGIVIVVISCLVLFLLSECLTGFVAVTFRSLPYIERVRWNLK